MDLIYRGYRLAIRETVQGTRWASFYRLERSTDDYTITLPFRHEQSVDETFDLRSDAESAAIGEAKKAIDQELARKR